MALIGPVTARRSNATNAYDWIEDSLAYAREEPKRLFMGDWGITARNRDYRLLVGRLGLGDGPACGTVGCWAVNLGMTRAGVIWFDNEVFEHLVTSQPPTTNDAQRRALFEAMAHVFYATEVRPHAVGTPGYVSAVEQLIRDTVLTPFEAVLRAWPLADVPREGPLAVGHP